MVGPYRGLFGTPGVKGFVVAGFIGRAPMSMLGIGVILLITATTGSYAKAGAVAATLSIAVALAGPLAGRLVDRFGQARVLVPLVLLHACSLTALMLCAHASAHYGLPEWTLYAAGVASGATGISLGSMVRARWSHVLVNDPAKLHIAFSFESVADEVIFVGGPAFVTALTIAINPYAGLIAAIVLTVSGTLAFAAMRGTEPPAVRHQKSASSPIAIPGVAVLSAVFLAMGAVFGSVDIITVAFAEEHGSKGAAGLLLASIASGSAVSGLWYGSRRWKISLRARFVRGLSLFAAGLTPVLLMHDVRIMALALFVAGLSISPTVITGFSLVERLVPATQLNEGMAWITTSINLGVAVGSWAGGRLTDVFGASNAYGFSYVCALLAVAVGLGGSALVRVRQQHTN
ncbi:MFS transporter [Microbispora rosea subsp. aerata]|nr:MFS transporter [Microbispora rosea]GGO26307.1 MFS transporter [Microbispora rosea subsp. aerata]GIH54197.1 MFS transporter [Microbispora rosea subsp. aerata]GLJ83612.1 MFS transporter [Microbispora rosea subsp. aerata]